MSATQTEATGMGPDPVAFIHAAIRKAGGIVHSDGNIFFTNEEKFMEVAGNRAVFAAIAGAMWDHFIAHRNDKYGFTESVNVLGGEKALRAEFITAQVGFHVCPRHDFDIVADPEAGCPKCNAEHQQTPTLLRGGAPSAHKWPGPGPEPKKWFAADGTLVYRSYEDYVDD
jgi:hypothetical protein